MWFQKLPNSLKLLFTISLAVVVFTPILLFFLPNHLQLIPSRPELTPMPLRISLTPTASADKEGSLLLKKGEEITIINRGISVKLLENIVPERKCNDCITTTKIQVQKNGQQEVLTYSCGGFSGQCVAVQTAYGNKIEIIDQNIPDQVKIKVK